MLRTPLLRTATDVRTHVRSTRHAGRRTVRRWTEVQFAITAFALLGFAAAVAAMVENRELACYDIPHECRRSVEPLPRARLVPAADARSENASQTHDTRTECRAALESRLYTLLWDDTVTGRDWTVFVLDDLVAHAGSTPFIDADHVYSGACLDSAGSIVVGRADTRGAAAQTRIARLVTAEHNRIILNGARTTVLERQLQQPQSLATAARGRRDSGACLARADLQNTTARAYDYAALLTISRVQAITYNVWLRGWHVHAGLSTEADGDVCFSDCKTPYAEIVATEFRHAAWLLRSVASSGREPQPRLPPPPLGNGSSACEYARLAHRMTGVWPASWGQMSALAPEMLLVPGVARLCAFADVCELSATAGMALDTAVGGELVRMVVHAQLLRSRAADPLYYLWNPTADRRSWRLRVGATTYTTLMAANPSVSQQ